LTAELIYIRASGYLRSNTEQIAVGKQIKKESICYLYKLDINSHTLSHLINVTQIKKKPYFTPLFANHLNFFFFFHISSTNFFRSSFFIFSSFLAFFFFVSGDTTRYQIQGKKMFQSFLKLSVLHRSSPTICTSCYRRSAMTPRIINTAAKSNRLISSLQPQLQPQRRLFHSSRPSYSPIIPIPAIILGALKTGKLVSLVSLSSKTSLTLLPHTFRRGSKGDKIAKVLAAIPLIGFTLLLVVGLDQVRSSNRNILSFFLFADHTFF
jgi:hypothetical protein